MKLTLLAPSFSVIQVERIDPSILKIVPLFFAHTSEELSLVLPTAKVPAETLNTLARFMKYKRTTEPKKFSRSFVFHLSFNKDKSTGYPK